MHELGLMQEALEVILDQTRRQGASRVHRVRFRVGELSGVVPEALQLAFAVVTQGTAVEGAELEVERLPVRCQCRDCGTAYQPTEMIFTCPECGMLSTEALQGRELELTALEVS